MTAATHSTAAISAHIKALLRDELDRAEAERAAAPPRTEDEVETRATHHEDAAREMRRALARNDPSAIAGTAERLRAGNPGLPAPGNPVFAPFARQLMLAMVQLHKINAARERGDYDDATVATLLAGPTPASATPAGGDAVRTTAGPADASPPPGKTAYGRLPFADAYNMLIRAKTGAPWRAETVRDARNARDYFLQITGNKRVCDITDDDAIAFRETLRRIPKYIGKGIFRVKAVGDDGQPTRDPKGRPIYKTMPIRDAIAALERLNEERRATVMRKAASGKIDPDNLEHEIAKASLPRLSRKTVNKHFDLVSQLFKWIADVRKEPLTNVFYKSRLKINKNPRNDRPMHTRAQVRALFASPAWTGCSNQLRRARPGPYIIKDAFYWIPLGLAHQGARLEEIAQLRVKDIFKTDKVWCLTIRAEEEQNVKDVDGQRLKNESSYRTIPIHPLLLDLGFIAYVEKMKKAGKIQLFPELRRDSRGRLGGQISRWSTTYRRAIKQYEPGRDGHALRHSFNTFLERAFVMTTRRKELMGHVHVGETDGRYLKAATLAALFADISKLDYGIVTQVRHGQVEISRELTLEVKDGDE